MLLCGEKKIIQGKKKNTYMVWQGRCAKEAPRLIINTLNNKAATDDLNNDDDADDGGDDDISEETTNQP